MEKKMLWLGLMLMVVGLCSSGALASTLGPPAAGLDAGQFSIGLEASSSNTAVLGRETWVYRESYDRYVNGVKAVPPSGEWDDSGKYAVRDQIKSEQIFARLGYGITDKVEVFARLGLSDLEFDGWDISEREYGNVDELAYGFGVKATVYDGGKLKLGSLFQMNFFNYEGDFDDDEDTWDIDGHNDRLYTPGDWEVDYYEMKFAVGPTYQISETFSIYGGPFYKLVDGEIDMERSGAATQKSSDSSVKGTHKYYVKESIDFKQRSRLGMCIGTQINFGGNLPFCVEYQTNFFDTVFDTHVVGMSLVYEF